MKNKKSRIVRYVIIIMIVLVFSVGVLMFFYVMNYYHSDSVAKGYMDGTQEVTVSKIEEGWLFDGTGTDQAIIFYPGAKVEETAYAPLLYRIAESGMDCFLVKMPFRLAIFAPNKAESILDTYDYDKWYMAGHSLGGAMAGNFAADHTDSIAGVIFLASYSTKDLSAANIPVISIYGSEDKVLNRENLIQSRKLMPEDYTEVSIEGGNHSGFGNYGFQKGDGDATISKDEQQEETVLQIMRLLEDE